MREVVLRIELNGINSIFKEKRFNQWIDKYLFINLKS